MVGGGCLRGQLATQRQAGLYENPLVHQWVSALFQDGFQDPKTAPGYACPPRHWQTRKHPLAGVWPRVEQWLEQEPGLSAMAVLTRLVEQEGTVGVDRTQLRTLQRRIKQWRSTQVDCLLHAPWSSSNKKP